MTKESVDELRATFEYHPDGYLIRKKNGKPCGQRVDTSSGYARVRFGGKLLLAHRVIYAIVRGKMPEGQIDHIDRNPMNNRIENLRDVSGSENQHNSKKRKTNTSGCPGVYWHAHIQKWRAYIIIDNRRINLGYFSDREDAVYARKLAKIKHHPSSPDVVKYIRELFPCG